MKKMLSIIIAVFMVAAISCLCACSGSNPPAENNPPAESSTPEPVPAVTLTPVPECLQGNELISYFQFVYDLVAEQDIPQEHRLETELLYLLDFNTTEKELPSDYEKQYLDWRPENKNAEVELTTPTLTEIEFIDVQETVYATSDVNIRDYCSASGNKIGSLSKNQAIFRIGVGTGDGEGWSRVSMENGEVGFIKSEYLTLTKPVTQEPAEPTKPVETPSQGNNNTGNSGNQGGNAVDTNNNGIPDSWETNGDMFENSGGTTHINPGDAGGKVQDSYNGITIQ